MQEKLNAYLESTYNLEFPRVKIHYNHATTVAHFNIHCLATSCKYIKHTGVGQLQDMLKIYMLFIMPQKKKTKLQ